MSRASLRDFLVGRGVGKEESMEGEGSWVREGGVRGKDGGEERDRGLEARG